LALLNQHAMANAGDPDPWMTSDPWATSKPDEAAKGYTSSNGNGDGKTNPGSAADKEQSWGSFQGPSEKKSDWNSWGQKEGSAGSGGNNGNQGQASWGSWGAEGATEKPSDEDWEKWEKEKQDHTKKMRWKDFTEAQDWYKEKNLLPGVHESDHLFDEMEKDGGGQDFYLLDHASSKVTGPKSENIPSVSTFEQLFRDFSEKIPLQLQENISRCGFKTPTPVQKYGIPAGLAGRDLMCCAQTGSGKTAAFLVPMLASMLGQGGRQGLGTYTEPFDGPCKPDVLVMAPTRELCVQIFNDALKFCHKTDFRVVRVYGQETVKTQILEIAKGADVCVATPGRLKDFTSAGIIDLGEVNCLVLDEADRMLEMGAGDDIKEIIENYGMPDRENRQTMMFSATFPEDVQKMAMAYTWEHLFVEVGAIGSACVTVTQVVQQVDKEKKPEELISFITAWYAAKKKSDRMLVFTNSKLQAKGLDEKLWDANVCNCGAMHGDLPQSEREGNLIKFRDGQIDVMVATDVASRGLDVTGVSHVVNYDLPREMTVYVQRIGRTGRIGHRGTAVTFIAMDSSMQNFLDGEEVLKELPTTMHGAPNTTVPDWLIAKANELKEGKWDTKGESTDKSDARANWGSWESQSQSWNDTSAQSANLAPGKWEAEQQPANNWSSGWTTEQTGDTAAQTWAGNSQ